ncbi:hypothetical protein VPH35_090207 [Triticum aestivum]
MARTRPLTAPAPSLQAGLRHRSDPKPATGEPPSAERPRQIAAGSPPSASPNCHRVTMERPRQIAAGSPSQCPAPPRRRALSRHSPTVPSAGHASLPPAAAPVGAALAFL